MYLLLVEWVLHDLAVVCYRYVSVVAHCLCSQAVSTVQKTLTRCRRPTLWRNARVRSACGAVMSWDHCWVDLSQRRPVLKSMLSMLFVFTMMWSPTATSAYTRRVLHLMISMTYCHCLLLAFVTNLNDLQEFCMQGDFSEICILSTKMCTNLYFIWQYYRRTF